MSCKCSPLIPLLLPLLYLRRCFSVNSNSVDMQLNLRLVELRCGEGVAIKVESELPSDDVSQGTNSMTARLEQGIQIIQQFLSVTTVGPR